MLTQASGEQEEGTTRAELTATGFEQEEESNTGTGGEMLVLKCGVR